MESKLQLTPVDSQITMRMNELTRLIADSPEESKRDLIKMWGGCNKLLQEISRAQVDCRRLHKDTPKYLELIKKLEERMDEVEQWATFARLAF